MRLSDGTAALSLLPGLANNDYGYNATSYNESIVTVGSTRYASWVNDAQHPIVGKRTLPSGAWSTFDLTTIGGLMGAVVDDDGHDVVNIGVDSAGFIHVSGNMHGDWLRYARSNAAGDISAFTNRDMLRTGVKTGTDEGLVSYPRFINNPATGEMLFMYRNGASGLGVLYLNRYNTATQTWSRVAALIDGTPSNESAYENTPVIDADGVMHLSWTWAANGSGFNDRNDVCYMRSPDGGTNWTDIDGNPLTLPVTRATAPMVLDTTTSNNGLLNTSGMDVDASGHPHIAMHYADDGNRNIFHLWHNGTQWLLEKVTAFTASGLGWEGVSARPDMICYGDRSFICWRHQYEGWRGKVWLSEVTTSTPAHFPIADMDLRDWEPTHDPAAVLDRDELVMIVSRVNWDNGTNVAPRAGYGNDDWTHQNLAVLSVDLTRIDKLKSGLSAIPRLPRP